MHNELLLCYNCEKLQEQISTQSKYIAVLEQQLYESNKLIPALQQQITNQAQELQKSKNYIYKLQKLAFGSRSEKSNKLKKTKDSNDFETKNKKFSSKNNKKNSPNRSNYRKIPSTIDRKQVELTLEEKEAVCSICGDSLRIIGSKVSEKLDISLELLKAIRYIRKQYACPHCKSKETMKIAPLPQYECPNMLATPKLLAWVINSKYNYHLPLYRISKILSEQGYQISEKTLNAWVIKIAFNMKLLLSRATDLMLKLTYVASDDTVTRLLIPGKSKTKRTRLWLYMSPVAPKIIIYDFTLTREGKHPQEFLSSFTGYLQTDAYPGYYGLFTSRDNKTVIIPVFCMSHCRRKFHLVAEKTNNYGLADEALEYFGKLYDIEAQAKTDKLTAKQILLLREKKSKPILVEFYQWLITHQAEIMPKTELKSAFDYAIKHWEALTNYCLDGNLEIDNNSAERKIRPVVLGRKNYLMFGSEAGGEAAAIFYSFIESCKENGISPVIWLADVIPKLNYYKTSQMDELLPHNWAKNKNIKDVDPAA